MNKLEELARLLGLKGKITCEKHCVGSKGVDSKGKSMCLRCSKSGLIYPDFTKPSNFVKLLNLVYKCGINQKYDFQLASMSFEEDDNSIWIGEIDEIRQSFETVWIECLLTSLQKNNPDNWDKLFTKKIQQQAQQIEWEY